MKAKLLIKVRKRFTITHYPKGIRLGNDFYDNNVFRLEDSRDSWADSFCELTFSGQNRQRFCDAQRSTEKECVEYLIGRIISRLRNEYPKLGSKGHNRIPSKKVWYLR